MQQSIASGEREISFRVGRAVFSLKKIPPGEFDLGSPATDAMAEKSEMPLQHIRITKAFYMGTVEVTQLQYHEIIGSHTTRFKGDSLPIEDITYSEAIEFCEELSRLLGMKVTLPTEAQWEYACRAGSHFRFCLGDEETDLQRMAWYDTNSDQRTHEVGQKEPNGFGLYDMLGNVWEPCSDSLPDYGIIDKIDPKGMVEVWGIMRGGWWHGTAEECRPSKRSSANDSFAGMGIRIVINPYDNSK